MEQCDILLAEDNADDVELMKRAFQKNNMQVNFIITQDGAETLEYLFRKGKYHGYNHDLLPRLILLDLKMPKVHGLEVLQQIRDNEKMKYIPVVILTSSQDKNDILRGYELGANSYVVKPIDFIKFSEVARQIASYWLTLNEQPSNKRGE
jgi:two-component system response regulator